MPTPVGPWDEDQKTKGTGKNGVKRDAYVPPELSIEGLYKLDVDQDIWQNADMADFKGGKVPLWLSDTEVQDGIWLLRRLRAVGKSFSDVNGSTQTFVYGF
ncbi:hypothetical protein BS47DRAFT_1364463 [Hydnum rufescens UP504]|uniref:Uncharacterized protein n=1 Tax=Hydnum rufescens UP504 TaxID=1448309 RepID=A0A9P6ASD1_9AGAM|nr:hypothetical protein BS47DRAFT_1364463 [Hydnum rufescens UP504]